MRCCRILVAVLACSALVFSADAARSLQQEALSNSNGCLDNIPKCETGACATRNVMGVARWVCLRCQGTYAPVVTADGQDNIIQCVCPRGTFETANGCERCPANSFCPGGDQVENPTSRGTNSTCGNNLVTRNTGARSQADCVAPAGYARTSPTSATPCGQSEYAPQFNRLSRCLRCQSGLAEQDNSGLLDGQRATKKAVCKIPPGRFMSQGLVRICPQGFFRANWVNFDDALGTLCLPCRPGITTNGAGKGLASDCNVVLDGYGITEVDGFNGTAPAVLPDVVPEGDGGYPNATLCNLGFYSKGGQCVGCPFNTVTLSKGAKSIEECVVPPGYFIPTAGGVQSDMQQCAAGSFRENFVMYSAKEAESCTSCGSGIDSQPRDLDQNPLAVNGSLVRGSSASCFITAGQGMIAQGKNTFVAQDCPINTYGAAGIVWGWAAAPCKPCPRNMITDNQVKVNNSEVCINDDGFGYASEGASRCAKGFYALKGSRKPCQQCPAGRTTVDNVQYQRLRSDCIVDAGFGVVNSTANSTDPFNVNATNASDLPVIECPVGYYGVGGTVDAKCTQCPAGSSTEGAGSQSVADCKTCVAGYGKASGSSVCTPCGYGTWQDGTSTTCSACESTTFYSPVDGDGATLTSSGTTAYTTMFGKEACFPIKSQLTPEAGQAYFAPGSDSHSLLSNVSAATTLQACVDSCPTDQCCLTQFDAKDSKCLRATLAPASSKDATKQIVYKLPVAGLAATASSTDNADDTTQAKTLSSGYFAHCTIPSEDADKWSAAGVTLGADARTFAKGTIGDNTFSPAAEGVAGCKKRCDASNVCWGFVWDGAAKSCSFRGGVDALKTRSFFAVPAAAQLAQYEW